MTKQDTPLEKAINLYQSGDKAGAGNLLKTLVRQDPNNESAWLWLAACVTGEEQKKYCLDKAQAINAQIKLSGNIQQSDPILNQPQTSRVSGNTQPIRVVRRPSQASTQSSGKKPAKKKNPIITLLAFLGLMALIISCLLGFIRGGNTSDQESNAGHTITVQPGTLSQYTGVITKATVINVYKKNGTLDPREGDLKELCLDWLYYGAKIREYVSSGDSDKADDARASFKRVNNWLDEYNEADVQTMFSIIEKNDWSNW